MPRAEDIQIASSVAERLKIPVQAVRIFSCPICGHRSFAGMLGAGSIVKVRCPLSSCQHHNSETPWIITIPGEESGRLRIHRCPSPVCKHPCRIRAPYMDSDSVVYANGKPVCNWTWCCAYFAKRTRIVAWCKESSCANYKNGFIIVS